VFSATGTATAHRRQEQWLELLRNQGAIMNPIAVENTTTIPFNFTGRTGEYFRIWIVNVMLTIASLGIYSAWAKVRNKRCFYGNTSVDGTAFDYHADPVAILKGRLRRITSLCSRPEGWRNHPEEVPMGCNDGIA
jgi:hypothetical protein